jgi:CheY-like chemotaxis protein
VESEYDKGSVFSIRFRQQFVSDAVIGKDVAKNLSGFSYTADRRSKNQKLVRCWIPYASVLVVDDIQMNLDVAKGMLKPYGMTVDCVESGQKAIKMIKEGKKYNAIFMDHMMPGMDGFEAVRIIRNEIENEHAKTVPIIALTANAIIGNEDLFLRNGFQAFLSKPIDIIRLDLIVNHYVRNKQIERELSLSGQQPASPENHDKKEETGSGLLTGRSLEGIDFAAGLKRFDGNEETYLDIVKSYSSQLFDLSKTVRSCMPKTELPPSAETLHNYEIAVHSIKSTSYTVGAKQIGSIAEALEKAAAKGDVEFVKTRNGDLLEAMERLSPKLKDFLDELQSSNQKPLRQAPDPAPLARMLEASANYDMEQMDKIMEELEQYRYETRPELINWLRKQLDNSELESIRERLSKIDI